MKKVMLALLAFFLAHFVFVSQVFAGTDINVQCSTEACVVNPSAVPLFNESNIWPGYTVTQQIVVQNTSTEVGTFGIDPQEIIPMGFAAFSASTLPSHIFIEIRQGSVGGPVVYGGGNETLQNLFDLSEVTLGTLNPGQNEQFFFEATLDPNIGNDLMNTMTMFDLNLGANFTPISPPQPPSSDNNSNSASGGGGGGSTNTSTRSAVCTDTPPRVAPTLFFRESSTSDGQITLGWSLVASADNYAINFGINPGEYIYGNNSVGNVTTYVVTGLTPNTEYFFQVIPLNGCAPGPRSNEISTSGNAAGANVTAPGGFTANQVLGVQEASGGAQPNGGTTNGEVLGEQSTCQPWKQFLPLIFLAVQVIISVAIYMIFKNPENKVKQIAVVVTIIITSVLFYFLRECNCAQLSIFAVLCKWYLVVAILVGLFTQFINYALIEREPVIESTKKKE